MTGRTGEAITLQAEIAEDSDDLVYDWVLLDQPDASMLDISHFNFSTDRSIVSFVPDAAGEYTLEVSVSHYGDELSIQSFTLVAEQGEAVPVNPTEPTEPDWYENENDREWFGEESITEDTIVEVPDITEIAPVIVHFEKINDEVKTPSAPPVIKSKPIPRGLNIPKNEGRFTIQIVSKKLLADAEVIAAKLINDGFDAYIQKAYFKETDEVWFRVRVGSYDSRTTALSFAKTISESRGTTTWVDYVRYEE